MRRGGHLGEISIGKVWKKVDVPERIAAIKAREREKQGKRQRGGFR